jgi:hypothetical protein
LLAIHDSAELASDRLTVSHPCSKCVGEVRQDYPAVKGCCVLTETRDLPDAVSYKMNPAACDVSERGSSEAKCNDLLRCLVKLRSPVPFYDVIESDSRINCGSSHKPHSLKPSGANTLLYPALVLPLVMLSNNFAGPQAPWTLDTLTLLSGNLETTLGHRIYSSSDIGYFQQVIKPLWPINQALPVFIISRPSCR